ncbi:MAG: hypothetical protein SNJ78_06300 [Spirochaetales bacterium]
MIFKIDLSLEELKFLYAHLKQVEDNLLPAGISLLRKAEEVVFQQFTIEEVEAFMKELEREK